MERHDPITIDPKQHLEHPPHRVRSQGQPEICLVGHRDEDHAMSNRMGDIALRRPMAECALRDNKVMNITE